MHICQCIFLIVVKKNSLQSYDKVSINSSVYNFSTAAKCARNFIPLFCISPHFLDFQTIEKTTLIFILNHMHRLIKKGVNEQIKLFHLVRMEQAINLWVFPLGSKSFILVFIVL